MEMQGGTRVDFVLGADQDADDTQLGVHSYLSLKDKFLFSDKCSHELHMSKFCQVPSLNKLKEARKIQNKAFQLVPIRQVCCAIRDACNYADKYLLTCVY